MSQSAETAYNYAMQNDWKSLFEARLHAERAHLLWALTGLDDSTVATNPVWDDWTAKDLLAHIGFWDSFHTRRIELVHTGKAEQIEMLTSAETYDAKNVDVLANYKNYSVAEAVAQLEQGRDQFLRVLHSAQVGVFQKSHKLPDGSRVKTEKWARWRWAHDANHAKSIAGWRKANQFNTRRTGSHAVLSAAYRAMHREFSALIDLIPLAERTTLPVCGAWSARELVNHLCGWNRYALKGLETMVSPSWPEGVTNFDTFNAIYIAERADQSWVEAWAELEATQAGLEARLAQLTQAELDGDFYHPYSDTMRTVYGWFAIWLHHEMEHSADLRATLNLPKTPTRLKKL